MRNAPDYVWEKMYVATTCMCGGGPIELRLANATVSALARLNDEDLDGSLGEDLKYILKWTKHNVDGGNVKSLPNDVEHGRLVEKMLHIVLELHER